MYNKENLITRLKSHLRELEQISGSPTKAAEFDEYYQEVYEILFTNEFYLQIWDESILLPVNRLLEEIPPNMKLYGERVALIKERAKMVKTANDLFFSVLDSNSSEEEVIHKLKANVEVDPSVLPGFKSSSKLLDIRSSSNSPSEKIETFLSHISDDLEVDFSICQEALQNCLIAFKDREGSGVVNTLLVNMQAKTGVLIPMRVRVQSGQGQVKHLVPGREDFKTAVERAMQCLKGDGFLRPTDDILYTLDVTEAEYVGDSIALASAIAMFSGASGVKIDPYTAFSGNINISQNGQWAIVGVSGIPYKLQAARAYGCRRIFLPRENEQDVSRENSEGLIIIFVNNLTEALLKLHMPQERLQADALHLRKISYLRSVCQSLGWQLSDPMPIQSGLQFTIAPPVPPELKLNIYYTGAHSPKTHDCEDFHELFLKLSKLEESAVPIRKVQQTFLIQNPGLRMQIAQNFEKMGPAEHREEQYCDYSYVFEDGKQRLVVKQFNSGKLQIQGTAGDIYKKTLEVIIPLYNLKYPQSKMKIEDYLLMSTSEPLGSTSKAVREAADIPLPYIGTDESGKGDYFGPLVVSGVWADASILESLQSLGVRDSKMLSDKRCREIAEQIRSICKGKYVEVEISPERYNTLYDEFKAEKKNLNHLLAWGHARAMESLLERLACGHAVADQFGDEQYIKSRLMQRGKTLELIQIPKGERYLAVAAASILARDCFLRRLEQIGREFGLDLPKGASDAVVTAAKIIFSRIGLDGLQKVAKLHFKTTSSVMGKT